MSLCNAVQRHAWDDSSHTGPVRHLVCYGRHNEPLGAHLQVQLNSGQVGVGREYVVLEINSDLMFCQTYFTIQKVTQLLLLFLFFFLYPTIVFYSRLVWRQI